MPYIVREQLTGVVTQLHDAGEPGSEWLEGDHPDVLAFLQKISSNRAKQALSDTDNDMVRVIDDLVDLLVANQLLIFTELPEQVQTKLLARKQLRKEVSALQNLMVDDVGLF